MKTKSSEFYKELIRSHEKDIKETYPSFLKSIKKIINQYDNSEKYSLLGFYDHLDAEVTFIPRDIWVITDKLTTYYEFELWSEYVTAKQLVYDSCKNQTEIIQKTVTPYSLDAFYLDDPMVVRREEARFPIICYVEKYKIFELSKKVSQVFEKYLKNQKKPRLKYGKTKLEKICNSFFEEGGLELLIRCKSFGIDATKTMVTTTRQLIDYIEILYCSRNININTSGKASVSLNKFTQSLLYELTQKTIIDKICEILLKMEQEYLLYNIFQKFEFFIDIEKDFHHDFRKALEELKSHLKVNDEEEVNYVYKIKKILNYCQDKIELLENDVIKRGYLFARLKHIIFPASNKKLQVKEAILLFELAKLSIPDLEKNLDKNVLDFNEGERRKRLAEIVTYSIQQYETKYRGEGKSGHDKIYWENYLYLPRIVTEE